MNTRYVSQHEMADDERAILAAWMVYHGINIEEAEVLEFTKYGYVHVFYKEGADALVTVELEVPAWL